MGFSHADTVSILAEIRLLEINHRVLDAGEPFAAIGVARKIPTEAFGQSASGRLDYRFT
jgi:hypothetical protein